MCGYYAIAAALCVCQGEDPTRRRYDVQSLYDTVRRGLHKGHFKTPQYTIDTDAPENLAVRRYSKLHCLCQSPSDRDTIMVQCTPCKNWYHVNCVSLSQGEIMHNSQDWSGPYCSSSVVQQQQLILEMTCECEA
jgi:PHD-finger